MSFLINPYAFLAAGGDFEPIATVTVGSGGAANVEFTSIPGTYQHLQVRCIIRGAGTGNPAFSLRLNGDTGSNYARHALDGNGASASAFGVASNTLTTLVIPATASHSASIFGAGIVDILDYASTSKTTTMRSFTGKDTNGAGDIGLRSALWTSTNAVTDIAIYGNQNFAQHSTAALYGLRAP